MKDCRRGILILLLHIDIILRRLATELGFTPVVPPRGNRINPWSYDETLYRRRNEFERLFRRLKGCRHIFSRFDKRNVMFIAFIHLALTVEALRPPGEQLV